MQSTRFRLYKRILLLVGGIFLVSYMGGLLYLYSYQRHLVFKPSGQLEAPAHYGLTDITPITLTTGDGVHIRAWYHPAPSDTAPMVMYFHGNSGNLGGRAKKIKLLAEHMGVIAISYRGYSGSEGEPSEQGFYEDARTALRYAHSLGIHDSRIIVYGESLGTGVAVQMATEYTVAGLVLEAPYTSLPALGAREYPYVPVAYLMKDKFDSLAKITHINSPLLIFHGEADPTIPIDHSRTLLANANAPKEAVFFPSIHHTDFDLGKITGLTYAFALSVCKP